jgi:hypothetical protein
MLINGHKIESLANLTGADLTGANLTGANLTAANLTDAKLTNADLTSANLTAANLTDVILTDANLSNAALNGTIGNMVEICSMQIDTWPIAFTSTHLQIGCQNHPIEYWETAPDDKIFDMAIGALSWWKKWKTPILTIVRTKFPKPE